VVACDPDGSALFARVTADDEAERMPSGGDPLPQREVAILRAWIAAGARWPDDLATLPAALLPAPPDASGHWAFAPLAPAAPPPGDAPHPIDRFLDARLAEAGLAMAEEADPATLLRRASFDITGLPPAPGEIAPFADDVAARGAEAAMAALADRLLASRSHAERYARHWLDVVRFAESNGFEMNQMRHSAWRYRDWVIGAIEADMPYDAFVRAQLAGDTLGADVATGFLVGGPWDQVKSPDPVLTANQRADELHDMVSTTATAFLGLTVGCARCHDHKFDPVPQADYYALKAVFAGVQHGERPIPPPPGAGPVAAARDAFAAVLAAAGAEKPRPAVTHRTTIDRFAPVTARFVRFRILESAGAEPCIDELEVFATDGRNVARGAALESAGDFAGNAFHRLEHLTDGLYGNEHSWISNTPSTGEVRLVLAAPESIDRVAWGRDRSPEPRYADRVATAYEIAVSADGTDWLPVAGDLDRLPFGDPAAGDGERLAVILPGARGDATSPAGRAAAARRSLATADAGPMAYAGRFTAPEPTHRLFRGDPMAPREEVAPGALSRIGGHPFSPADPGEAARRRALAEWIVDPANPLTARVIVNRLWHWHFGTGLVDTPSDFGAGGGRPSHPELLDWLAGELVAGGWRLRPIHRLIVTSRAYRQSSRPLARGLEVDAADRLLWRYPPRRLEAEAIRDAILAVAGTLEPSAGGPGFDLFVPNANYVKVYETKTEFTADDFRRMVYQAKPRCELDTFFGPFDCPDAAQIQPTRTASTTPLQALNLLNGAFLLEQAGRFAARVSAEAGEDPEARVRLAILLAFQRPASPEEVEAGRALVAAHGLPALCRALYNANEFISLR
ncbi:MAG: DUF1549 and DUF1553 domain-containing protein, partial [Planctomycetaceae bacterium]